MNDDRNLNPEGGANIQQQVQNKKEPPLINEQVKPVKMNKFEEQKLQMMQKLLDQQVQRQSRRRNFEMLQTPLQKVEKIPPCTIDEDICSSFGDEICKTITKFRYVVLPVHDEGAKKLRNWDLWGPFFMAVAYLLFIDKNSLTVRLVFGLFIGSGIVTFNVVALGGKLSIFQCFSILSYCIFPLFFASIIIQILAFLNVKNKSVNKIIFAAATIWSIISSRTFIGVNVPEDKRFVAVYPAAIFYIYLTLFLAFS